MSCTATDADLQRTTCGFGVNVRVSQTLTRTRFLAFGDSITAGTLSRLSLWPTAVDRPDSYPFKLEHMLRERYPTQEISVVNRGFGGERLDEGVRRLPSVLNADQPEVLLLLEGIVAIRLTPTARNARHLRTMISEARQRQVDVILATVMPVGATLEAREPGITTAIRALNVEIVRLAQEFDLGSPVDLYGLFLGEPSLLGADGLHPTVDGYTRIAEAFRDAILARYDQRAGLTIRRDNRSTRFRR